MYEGPVQQRSGRGEHRTNYDQSAGGDGDAPAGADPASEEGRHLLGRSAVYLTEGLVVEHPLLHWHVHRVISVIDTDIILLECQASVTAWDCLIGEFDGTTGGNNTFPCVLDQALTYRWFTTSKKNSIIVWNIYLSICCWICAYVCAFKITIIRVEYSRIYFMK